MPPQRVGTTYSLTPALRGFSPMTSCPTLLISRFAGYLGTVIAEHFLDAGHSVIGVENLSFGSAQLNHLCAQDNFDFVPQEVRNGGVMATLVKKIDMIIPLAALVGMPACLRDAWLAESVNLQAIRIINRVRSSSQLVIYPKTNSGCGHKSGTSFCTEETLLEPISICGKTKCQAELELLNSSNTITLLWIGIWSPIPHPILSPRDQVLA